MPEQETKKKRLSRQELGNKPTLIITKGLVDKITYLHKMVGNHEWSGELITREEGLINELENWTITAEDVFLADIGVGMYTEYNVDKGGFKAADVIELYETFPGLEDGTLKNQHIHTHVNSGVFFSGTDWEQLEDRACASNYVLMLIVNMKGDAIAKVAFKATKEGGNQSVLSFANNADGLEPITLGEDETEDVLVVMDCIVKIQQSEIEIDEEFKNRYERVKAAIEEEKEAEKKKKPVYSGQGKLPYYGGDAHGKYGGGVLWDSEREENVYNPHGEWTREWEETNGVWHKKEKKEKKISDMTAKEFEQWEELEAAERVFRQDSQPASLTFDYKDAIAFLNSIFDNSFMMENYKEVKDKLLEEDAGLKTEKQMDEWVDDWQISLQDHFDVIYAGATIEDYVIILGVIDEYLNKYKYIRIVGEMKKALEEEMEVCAISKIV